MATKEINVSLLKSYTDAERQMANGEAPSWRSQTRIYKAPEDCIYNPGNVNFSAGWFAQGHEVGCIVRQLIVPSSWFMVLQTLNDPIVTSTSLRHPDAEQWLILSQHITHLLNAVTAVTHLELYRAGSEAIHKIMNVDTMAPTVKHRLHENSNMWTSVFSGVSIISNRITPSHRDKGGDFPWYDLLLSIGTHQTAYLKLPDIDATMSYKPGTVVLLCGKILSHAVDDWSGGERICWAYYMRNWVHERLGIMNPSFVERSKYVSLMGCEFVKTQGW